MTPFPAPPGAALVVLALLYLPAAVVLARRDGEEHRLPNATVAVHAGLTVLGLLAAAGVDVRVREALPTAAMIALAAGLLAVLVALLAPPLLGMGDAKVLPAVVLMATVLGGEVLVGGVLAAALLAGAAGTLTLLRTRRAGVPIPLGPFLLAVPFLGLLTAPLVRTALGG